MEINEVKVGDIVTFKNKQGTLVKGKVIHRHVGVEKPHLAGHVNIEKMGGVPSYPFTVHVSKIKPVLEETQMDLKENINKLIDAIASDDKVAALDAFNRAMEQKVSDALDAEKVVVGNALFAEEEEEVITQDEFDALSDEEKEEWVAVAEELEEAENLGEEEYDYYRDMRSGGASRRDYHAATRNFRRTAAAQRKPVATSPTAGSHSVHIDGKKWKSFSTQSHATNVAKKLEAKGKKATVHKD